MKQFFLFVLFPFLVLSMPCDTFSQNCQEIRSVPRKNTKVKVFESPDSNAVQFTKDVLGKNITYRIHLRMMRPVIDLGQKGVTILFDDGSKLVKPEETVDVNNLDDKFEFTSTLTLLPEELLLLQKKKITGFILFTYQKDITSTDGEKFRSYAKCIIKK